MYGREKCARVASVVGVLFTHPSLPVTLPCCASEVLKHFEKLEIEVNSRRVPMLPVPPLRVERRPPTLPR